MVAPDESSEDFEDRYTAIFKELLAGHGLTLEHHRDRVGIDLGLQLRRLDGSPLSHKRVWFQLKGKRTSTISAEAFRNSDWVHQDDLRVDHVRFWYAGPEPVYLCIYIESVNEFVAGDVRDLVEDRFGGNASKELSDLDQKSTRLSISTTAKFNSHTLNVLKESARSIRIDGPSFRGRPLGHRFDPLRSRVAPMEPGLFFDVTDALLEAHGFRVDAEVPPSRLLEDPDPSLTRLAIGTLYNTWEWSSPLFHEFGYGPGSDFRIEGEFLTAHGPVALLIDANPPDMYQRSSEADGFLEELDEQGIAQLLMLLNAPDDEIMAHRLVTGERTQVPQGLGSLTQNILVTTLVYLRFREELEFDLLNYL